MKATGWLFAVAAAAVAAVAAALVSQHVYGMQPCPWCVLQRLVFLAVAGACAIGLVWRSRLGQSLSAAVGLALSACGGAAALWQHFRAAASASCNLTLADQIVSGWLHLDSLWPEVFSPRASCADAAVSLLGVPYDLWSLAAFVLMALALTQVLRRPPRLFR